MPYTRDKSLFYRVTGEGLPVVFVHGAGGSGRLFGNQFQAFRGRARCYFVDLPGHGDSPASIESYAAVVIRLLEELGGPAILLGHSMGGAIALDIALTRPDLLRGLVLVGTGGRLPVSEKILLGLESDYDKTLDAIVRYCFSKNADPDLLDRARTEMRRTPADIVRGDFHFCNAFDVCDRLHEVAVPTHIICGEKDFMTPPSLSEHLHRAIPNSQLDIIPAGSHMLMLESADLFNNVFQSKV